MQPYDIFMLVVLVGAAAFGAWKGMAWQLASIASVALSAIVALRFSGLLAPSLSPEEPWNQFLAMGILFAGTSLAVWIAFRFVAKIIDRVKLKEFDRQMGALFGAAKGILYCLILTFFAVTLNESTRQRVLDSRSGYYAAVLVEKGTPLMPEKVRTALGKYIRRLDQGLDPGTPPITPESVAEELIDTAVANGDIPFPPIGGAETGAEQPGLPLTDPNNWPQAAQDVVGQYTGQFGGQPAAQPQPQYPSPQPQYPTRGYQSWQQDAQNYMNEQANQIGQQVGNALQSQANEYGQQVTNGIQQRVDQYGRQVNTAIDQRYNQLRSSYDNTAGQIQDNVQRGVDELGRRIQQAPMRPIQ